MAGLFLQPAPLSGLVSFCVATFCATSYTCRLFLCICDSLPFMNSSSKQPKHTSQTTKAGKHTKQGARHASPLGKHTDQTSEPLSFSELAAIKTAETIEDRRSTLIAILALIVAGAITLFALNSCVSCSQQSENEASSRHSAKDTSEIESSLAPEDNDFMEMLLDFKGTPTALDKISSSESLQSFSLSNLPAPTLSSEEQEQIESAIAAIEPQATVGIVFYDIKTGRGITYNPDSEIYGASSFKAPYALYICEQHVENGELALPGVTTDTFDARGSQVKSLIEESVINSDNDAFGTLRTMYDFAGFNEWTESLGVNDTAYLPDSWFPWYTARSSAKIWTEMYDYFQSDSPTAAWLRSLCEQTNLSFLRNAVEPQGALVHNKAGWCSGSDYAHDYNGLCDAGIVELDGNTYIMSVMTGLSEDEDNFVLIENLIAAVFATHNDLD